MLAAIQVAKRICELNQWKLKNVELQHVLYLTHLFYYGQDKGKLIKDKFEACKVGIVVPSLYLYCRIFGEEFIKPCSYFKEVSPVSDEGVKAYIDKTYSFLMNYSPTGWQDLILNQGHAWKKHWRYGKQGAFIPEQDILADFQAYR
jgi:uncharacterized phage-associated protein